MSINKRKLCVNTVSVNLCCSCRKPRVSSIFNPKPKSKLPIYHKHQNFSNSSSTSDSTRGKTGNYSSLSSSHPSKVDGFGRVGPKSVAVEKDSSDPYLDFRQSMVQMIIENEIYYKDELKELLNCFLQLNSPSLHGIIIRVFTDIWNTFFLNE